MAQPRPRALPTGCVRSAHMPLSGVVAAEVVGRAVMDNV